MIFCRELFGGGDNGKNVLDVGSPVKGLDVGGEGLRVGVEFPINQIIRDDPRKRTVYLLSWDVTSADSSLSCETSPSSKNDDLSGDFPRRRFRVSGVGRVSSPDRRLFGLGILGVVAYLGECTYIIKYLEVGRRI